MLAKPKSFARICLSMQRHLPHILGECKLLLQIPGRLRVDRSGGGAQIPVRSETHEENKEKILKSVKMWPESSRSGDWILLLDNADNVADFESNNCAISKFLPRGLKGNIIATTRSLAMAQREDCGIITVGKVRDSKVRELSSCQLRISHNDQTKDEQAVSNVLKFLGYCGEKTWFGVSERKVLFGFVDLSSCSYVSLVSRGFCFVGCRVVDSFIRTNHTFLQRQMRDKQRTEHQRRTRIYFCFLFLQFSFASFWSVTPIDDLFSLWTTIRLLGLQAAFWMQRLFCL
ncbi:hypothetical protein L873DRAFT_127943 [Choiromyces venosus 120613-1]|uniref:NB-ARC domain-containing protein n=1 Tax=Choiromyces venosus 120613-1 TaxID=1336337 RepID=A0A3N4J907_9PEZI|nr:hypothetical protein L873DRAFT_127943 [Choiromyces venosus 120613-1]